MTRQEGREASLLSAAITAVLLLVLFIAFGLVAFIGRDP